MRGSVAVLRTINSALTKRTCVPNGDIVLATFTNSIKDLTIPLLSGGLGPDKLESHLDKVLSDYSKVLTFTRCLAIDTVHHEVLHAHQ